MELEVILGIISAALAGLVALFGKTINKGKSKLAKAATLAKETAELVGKASEALEDNKVTKEEVESLKKELADVKAAWKLLFEKEIAE